MITRFKGWLKKKWINFRFNTARRWRMRWYRLLDFVLSSYLSQYYKVKLAFWIVKQFILRIPSSVWSLIKRVCFSIYSAIIYILKVLFSPFYWIYRVIVYIVKLIHFYRSEIFQFLHITAGVFFVGWGIETLLPWTTWKILLGLYILGWAGYSYTANIFWYGSYVSDED